MIKCEKCGHFNPYWLPDFHDVEREYAKVDDIEGARALPLNQIVEKDGFAWKRTGKYVRRLPLEIFRARGRWATLRDKKYFDPQGNSSGIYCKANRDNHSSSQRKLDHGN